MKARVGDRLVLAGGPDRYGVVVGVLGKDGAPPYIIRWRSHGHVAMVFPDQYARIVPHEDSSGSGRQPGTNR
jgi:Domain of unknown function (DUF1918)